MEKKFTLSLFFVGCLVVSTTAQCNTGSINACFSSAGFPHDYGHPVLLRVPEDQRSAFCGYSDDYTACIDIFRPDCTEFSQWIQYSSFERMCQFVCGNDGDGLEQYGEYYDVINNQTYREAWESCDNGVGGLVGDEGSEGCGVLDESVQCYLTEIEEESPQAQTYVGNFAEASLVDYSSHYACSGSSARITFSLMIISLLAYLWSTFH